MILPPGVSQQTGKGYQDNIQAGAVSERKKTKSRRCLLSWIRNE